MDSVTTVLILMFSITVLALLASKIGVPYPTMMVVGGLLICFVPGLHADINPNIVFNLFLPPLIYGAAWQMSWKDFYADRQPIFLLAFGLVLFTTVGIAIIAHFVIPGFGWPEAFALGAIVSPTDAIAVTALAKKAHLPRRVVFLLDGESMVNDASALVVLKIAMTAALVGSFSFTSAIGQFLLNSIGGIAVGLAMGWAAAWIHRKVQDPLIETTITFLTPYATFLIPEQFQLSGVLSTVVAGLYISWQAHEIMTPQQRVQANTVWEFALFIFNGFAFVFLGLGMPAVLKELPSFENRQLIAYGALLVAVMIALRIAWVVPGTFLPWLVNRDGLRATPRPSARRALLIGWTGMRGVVSLAAALALPMAVGSKPGFPNRGLIIFLTFFATLVTLVFQSLTLPMVIRLLKVGTLEDEESEERSARVHAARAGLSFIKDLTASTDAFGDAGKELLENYEKRLVRLESGPLLMPLYEVGIEISTMDLKREALSAERKAIVELRAQRKIGIELFQRLMADLDVEELKSLD